MLHYSLKSLVPTTSLSKGIFQLENELFFATNTFIFRVKEGEYKICGILEGYVRQFICKQSILYVITEDSLVLIYDCKNIASLKCVPYSLLVSEKFIVLGTECFLEVWYTPKEYKFGMFDLHSKVKAHNDIISCLLFLTDKIVITGSRDCSIKTYNLQTKDVDRLISTKSIPVKICLIKDYIVVICEEGQIYYVNILTKKIDHKIFKNATISCADQFENLICICVFENAKSTIEIISEQTTIYSFDTVNIITEIGLCRNKVAIKGPNFVGILNFEIDTYIYSLDLPQISCFDIYNELYCVGCTDKKIRLYDDKKCIKTLYDEKNTHPLLDVYFLSGSVLSLAVNGYISLFDIKNSTCYRSFNIPVKISASAICDDGMLLFLADYDSYKIRVIDLQRSREIDNLEGHEAPVKNLYYADNYLFSLSTDNELKKWDVYKTECISTKFEKTAINFIVKNQKIYIVLINEIIIYNFDLEFCDSILYKSIKALENIDVSFDLKYLFLAGESNKLQIFDISNNSIEQTVKVSRNTRWKNYREILFKNQKESCDKSEKIEVLKLIHSKNQYKFTYLSREGIFTYEKSTSKYLPLCLDLETTVEAITKYLENNKFLNALIVALKLKETQYVKQILITVPENEIEFVVKFLPSNMIEDFRIFLIYQINDNFNLIRSYIWMRNLIYYHGKGNFEQKVCKNLGEEAYKTTLENTFIFENLIE